jgi:hypothetical protein
MPKKGEILKALVHAADNFNMEEENDNQSNEAAGDENRFSFSAVPVNLFQSAMAAAGIDQETAEDFLAVYGSLHVKASSGITLNLFSAFQLPVNARAADFRALTSESKRSSISKANRRVSGDQNMAINHDALLRQK